MLWYIYRYIYLYTFRVFIRYDLMEYLTPPPERTKVTIARPGSKSLKTTIPEFIVKNMNIRLGDELEWNIIKDPYLGNRIMVGVNMDKRTNESPEAIMADILRAVLNSDSARSTLDKKYVKETEELMRRLKEKSKKLG